MAGFAARCRVWQDRHRDVKTPADNEKTELKSFYGVTYIPGLFDNKQLRQIINNNNINFAYKSNTTLSTIFTNTKTPIDKQQQNNVVYKIPCKGKANESCNKIYIGTTKRSLSTRMSEHKSDIEKQKETTALSQHAFHTGHSPDFDSIEILDKEKIEKKRLMIESLRIQQHIDKTMNLKEDTDNISSCYGVAIK
ncbi:uncharacterized protein LOC131802208 [Musca domestica]|uniref:Uncharacterized protein LOC131802208 n=1 Tax=Musca domestica TaxID=7370 RepID=A0ABM3UWI1_MUSDO|nr:uncharacterized protein LOC131802208 [Musca domestica]